MFLCEVCEAVPAPATVYCTHDKAGLPVTPSHTSIEPLTSNPLTAPNPLTYRGAATPPFPDPTPPRRFRDANKLLSDG